MFMNNLVRKFETLKKRATSATMCNSQILKSFPGQAGISIGKWPPVMKKHSAASVQRAVSLEPELAFSQVQNFKKEGMASFPGTQRPSKTNIGIYINRARENRRKKGDYAENFTVFPRRGRLHAQILPYSLRVDLQIQNFKTQRATLGSPRYSPVWPESWSKNGTPTWKNTLVASVPEAISLEPKLYFLQVQNFKEEGITSFPRTPRSLKTDIGSYINCTWENWRK